MNDDAKLLDQLLAEAGLETDDASETALVADTAPGPYPLSYAQELLWQVDQAFPGLATYNLPVVRRLRGRLDCNALERSLAAIAARHDVLHTRYATVDDEPVAIVDEPGSFDVDLVDLRGVAAPDRQARADALIDERAWQPFDLENEHVFRAALIRLDDDDHILLLGLHHIACDGWSLGIIFRELALLYCGDVTNVPANVLPIPIGYHDFARWQRERLQSDRYAVSLAYWRGEFATPVDSLKFENNGASDGPADMAVRYALALDTQTTSALRSFARARNATPYMTLLAVFAIMLRRYTGSTAFRIGSNVAARTNPALEPIVGYFNNTLALRLDFACEPTFDELLADVRTRCLGAFDNQDIPYEKLVLAARASGAATSEPLFNVVFSADDATGTLELPGVRVESYELVRAVTKFDLSLFMAETAQGVKLTLLARSRLWSEATCERFLEQFGDLARDAIERPGEPVDRLFDRSNATAAAPAAGDFLDRFESCAAAKPVTIALVCGESQMTYSELNGRANAFAELLRERGVAHQTPIGLAVERTTNAVAAYVAILKAGCIVVPFEPTLPPERIAQQLSIAGVTLAVTGEPSGLAPDGPFERIALDATAYHEADVARRTAPGDIAYIVFTSGSTGVPKGVAVTHACITNYTDAISAALGGVDAGWHFGLPGTLAADLGYTSFFPALTSCGTLHVLPADVTSEGVKLRDYLETRPLDVLKITPRHLRALASGVELGDLLATRWTILGGETLHFDFAQELVAAGRGRVLNHYGPTETTVGATTFEVTPASLARAREEGAHSIPIGMSLANVQTFVLDAGGESVPPGAIGELWIGGAGVAAGYFGRPDLTDERFSNDPALGRRYRTGDRVRRLASGALEFLGRLDDQVKIRGYRVELGEIEAALSQLLEVHDAAVTLDGLESPLTAYVVIVADAPALDPETLVISIKKRLEHRLPDYMVPQAIVVVEALPRTPNGKLDRSALPAFNAPPTTTAAAPHTPTQSALVEIWAAAFSRPAPSIGVSDDFLALGGHSLIAIRMLGQIKRRFGVRLSLASVLEKRTIENLAAVIDRLSADAPSGDGPGLARIQRVARPPAGARAEESEPG